MAVASNSMMTTHFAHETTLTLRRLLPRLEQEFADQVATAGWMTFRRRLDQHFPRDAIFAFVRTHDQQRMIVLANFTEREQLVAANEIRLYGLGYRFTDLISDQPLQLTDSPIRLEAYQVLWLVSA